MKHSVKTLARIAACILASFVVSLLAVHAFWIGAKTAHSVPVARAFDSVGAIALLPARTTLRLLDAFLSTSTLLPDPLILAAINGALVGLMLYACLRKL